jgi:hypothetical protein
MEVPTEGENSLRRERVRRESEKKLLAFSFFPKNVSKTDSKFVNSWNQKEIRF